MNDPETLADTVIAILALGPHVDVPQEQERMMHQASIKFEAGDLVIEDYKIVAPSTVRGREITYS